MKSYNFGKGTHLIFLCIIRYNISWNPMTPDPTIKPEGVTTPQKPQD